MRVGELAAMYGGASHLVCGASHHVRAGVSQQPYRRRLVHLPYAIRQAGCEL